MNVRERKLEALGAQGVEELYGKRRRKERRKQEKRTERRYQNGSIDSVGPVKQGL